MKQPTILLLLIFSNILSVQAQTDIAVIKKTHPSKPLKKILILSPVKNYENRKTLENEISWWINDKGFAAFSCNKLQKNENLPTTELIKLLVEENGFNGVLISDLVDVQMKERYKSNTQRNSYNPSVPSFYNYLDANNNAYTMGYNYNTKSFEVNTKLFKADDYDILFECNSNAYESTNFENAVESYAKALSRMLKHSKILEKKTD